MSTATAPRKRAGAKASAAPAEGVYDRIERKRSVLSRLADARAELSRVSVNKTSTSGRLIEARNALRGVRAQVEHLTRREDTDPEDDPRVKERVRVVEVLEEQLADLEAHHKDLTVEIAHLERTELPACQGDTGLDAVLDHQHRLGAARDQVAELEAAIEGRREAEETAIAAMPSLGELEARREALLAEIAVGNATEADLDALDGEIAREREAAEEAREEADRRAQDARQAVAGLERKLAVAREELVELEERTPEVLTQFLTTEAEQVCKAYLKAAGQVRDHMFQLYALSELLERHGGPGGRFLLAAWNDALLPTFSLPPCEGLALRHRPGVFFSTQADEYHAARPQVLADEQARLTGMGVAGL